MRFISRVLRIQKGEGRLAALVVALMFVAMAAFTIGQSGIDALFFDRVGAQALPVMYLLQGGATFVAMLLLTGTLGRLGPPVLLRWADR
jgi:hypothetical protein